MVNFGCWKSCQNFVGKELFLGIRSMKFSWMNQPTGWKYVDEKLEMLVETTSFYHVPKFLKGSQVSTLAV